ncbi:replication regulatory protein RepA [Cedecea sp. P7760]|uniref:replication regulatory protein RepA n=1 Tax=Cedecea sp. P7760 TaxID=2726983 RepID=UPI0015A3353F|nr:replication regulatory protein RepA [Cedecea sp. P7760]NWC63957.1 replication regulatory protein RepA [Cedecea sp. P7760]
MSQSFNAVSSSYNAERVDSKPRPLTASERQKALVERRKKTHKEIKVQVTSDLKESLQRLCKTEGITQAEMIARWIEKATSSSDM